MEAIMGISFLIFFHIIFVTAIYITAYRTGYAVCRNKSRQLAKDRAIPLMEVLEQLNLDTEKFLDNDKDR
jgi:hypothetical protein